MDENIQCHFFDYDCAYPMPKEELDDALANWDEEIDGDTLYQIPISDSTMCTNCMLATLIELINLKLK